MNNYEKITSSPESLALWLSYVRSNCECCPVECGCTARYLNEHIGGYDAILEWLKSEEKSDEV